MKTVLFFPFLYPSVTGGMEVYNYHLSNKLLSYDRNNIIMVTADPSQIDSCNVIRVSNKLFLIRRWGLDVLSMLVCCLFSSKTKIREWNCVMIPYTSSFDLGAWPILLFQKFFGFKYSIHCHGGGAKPWKHFKLQKKFFDRAVNKAAVSESLRLEYSKRLGYELGYLPPLVEFSSPQENIQSLKKKYGVGRFKKVILYVGSIKPLKAPEVLLKAYCSLTSEIKLDVCLLLAGDGPLREKLEQKYVSDSIIFLGCVPNNRVCELFTLADYYCIPSWFEGTSVSLLEAMSKQCCCLGTDVQGINSMIQNNVTGLLFQKDDATALAKLLVKVINDDILAHKLGEKAFEFYNTYYSYTNHISQVLEFIDYK